MFNKANWETINFHENRFSVKHDDLAAQNEPLSKNNIIELWEKPILWKKAYPQLMYNLL